jgi:alanine-synthesizing transaminase
MNTMDFGMLLLEKGNVAVSPGSGFGPAGEGFLRMSLVENEARLRQAVRQIKACLREAEGRFVAKVDTHGAEQSTRGVSHTA